MWLIINFLKVERHPLSAQSSGKSQRFSADTSGSQNPTALVTEVNHNIKKYQIYKQKAIFCSFSWEFLSNNFIMPRTCLNLIMLIACPFVHQWVKCPGLEHLKIVFWGVGGMASWIKFLLCKREGLSLNPWVYLKKSSMALSTCNPSTGWPRQDDVMMSECLGLVSHWLAS